MNRLALFDCDGTLVDSEATIRLAMDRAFEVAGLAAPGAAKSPDAPWSRPGSPTIR